MGALCPTGGAESSESGVDYEETYSPAVRYATVCYLLAGLKIHQLDAVTAFLQGDLTDEEIHVEQPEGFAIPGGQVCRLKKSALRTQQASCEWNKKLNNALREIGLHTLRKPF